MKLSILSSKTTIVDVITPIYLRVVENDVKSLIKIDHSRIYSYSIDACGQIKYSNRFHNFEISEDLWLSDKPDETEIDFLETLIKNLK